MAKVQSITLMFKNCESITVPLKYVGYFFIGDIKTNLETITRGCIEKRDTAKEFFIEIFSEANTKYDGFYNCELFERLYLFQDLYMIGVTYDDGTEQYINLDYYGTKKNAHEAVKISRLGNLYICVCAKKCLDDYILEKDMNNPQEVNLRKSSELLAKSKPKNEEEEDNDGYY